MNTIASGATTITPNQIDGYSTRRASRNVIHSVLSRPAVNVTLRPAQLRKGTLTLVFSTAVKAWEAVNLHAIAGILTLASTDVPQANMLYVVDGDISPALEDETRNGWVVTVDYQEVTA